MVVSLERFRSTRLATETSVRSKLPSIELPLRLPFSMHENRITLLSYYNLPVKVAIGTIDGKFQQRCSTLDGFG